MAAPNIAFQFIMRADARDFMIELEAASAKTKALAFDMERLGVASKLLAANMKITRNVLFAGAGAMGLMAVATASAFGVVADYEQSLRKAAAIGDLTIDQMFILNDLVLESAIRWGMASENIAEGVLELTKAGVAFEDMKGLIDVFTQAAVGNVVDFSEVVRQAVIIMQAFDVSASELPFRLDQIQKAANIALVDFQDFNEILKFAAANAVLTGVSFEQLVAASATLSNLGVAAGLTGRGINRMLTNIIQNSDELQKWIDRLDVAVDVVVDGKVNLVGMIGALKDTELTLEDVKESLEVFNIVGARTFAQLLLSGEQFAENLEDIKNAEGDVGRVAEFASQSLNNMLVSIQEIFFSVLRQPEFIEKLAEVLGLLKEMVLDNADAFQELFLSLITQFIEHLPSLLEMMTNLLNLGVRMLPTINVLAGVFSTFAGAIGMINPQLMQLGLTMLLIHKIGIAPMITAFGSMRTAMISSGRATDVQTLAWQRQAVALGAIKSIAMGAFFAFAALTTESDEQRAIFAALTGITWGLAAAQLVLAFGKGASLTHPFAWPLIAGALVAGASAAIVFAVGAAAKEFQTGIDFVPEDMFAVLHKGERIVPADENTFITGGFHGGQVNINVFDSNTEDILAELDRFMR